jgi:hypothetical protein
VAVVLLFRNSADYAAYYLWALGEPRYKARNMRDAMAGARWLSRRMEAPVRVASRSGAVVFFTAASYKRRPPQRREAML